MQTCWPVNIVAVIAILILLFDLAQQQWALLPIHALGGAIVTGVFWALCTFLGHQVAGAVLYVPLLFLAVFATGILFTRESLKRQGCCVTCASDSDANGLNGNGPSGNGTSGNGSSDNGSSGAGDQCELEKRKLKGYSMV